VDTSNDDYINFIKSQDESALDQGIMLSYSKAVKRGQIDFVAQWLELGGRVTPTERTVGDILATSFPWKEMGAIAAMAALVYGTPQIAGALFPSVAIEAVKATATTLLTFVVPTVAAARVIGAVSSAKEERDSGEFKRVEKALDHLMHGHMNSLEKGLGVRSHAVFRNMDHVPYAELRDLAKAVLDKDVIEIKSIMKIPEGRSFNSWIDKPSPKSKLKTTHQAPDDSSGAIADAVTAYRDQKTESASPAKLKL